MGRPALPSHKDARHRAAQRLADEIFGNRGGIRKPQPKPRAFFVVSGPDNKPFNKRKAEELAAEIFGPKDDLKERRQEQRERSRGAKKRKAEERQRCWDWLFHNGNVHSARNSSSFTTYTPLDPKNSCELGLGSHGALGIGTISLVAPRAEGTPENCTITLYDVLHMPSMPCNGISTPRLEKAGMKVLHGDGRTVVTHSATGPLLFAGFRMIPGFHRLHIYGNPQGPSPLLDSDQDIPFSIDMTVVDVAARRLGKLTRELQQVPFEIGVRASKTYSVGG